VGAEMKAFFNIHGLPVEVVADHPRCLEAIVGDLQGFAVASPGAARDAVRLTIHASPTLPDGAGSPATFAPHQEEMMRQRAGAGESTTSATAF